MSTLLPAERCAACEGSYLPGRRVIAGHRGGALLLEPGARLLPGYTARPVVTPGGPMQLATHGPCWTPEALVRAESAAGAGLHPWFCQRCLRLVCEACDSLWDRPIMHDVLDDGGGKVYVGFLGVSPRCRKCSKVTRP
jgi:hypothetical protein